MTALPEEVFNRITPWLDAQPDKVTYAALKDKLIQTYSMPVTERAQCALNLLSQPLGEASPREAWDKLRGLVTLPGRDKNGSKRKVDLTRAIFLRHLPQEVRGQIKDADALDMDALVNVAQKIHKATKALKHAAALAVATLGVCSPTEENDNSERDINAVYRKKTPFREHRTWSNPVWCFFHRKFGTNTRNCRPPCLLCKKQQKQPQVTAVAAKSISPQPAGFFIRDEISKRRLLVDMGAMQSVFPPSEEDLEKIPDSTPALIAANGTLIRTFGTTTQTTHLHVWHDDPDYLHSGLQIPLALCHCGG
ncbi:uncharacterized protein [Macrobrachium rosenbergii]|uniref:uncharacterized protein n=1 Tax=Macrobrachium rosenbergii TaxID=79674 RepID=UPI0034D523C7